ncbi:hypothetical protein SLS58_010352 [Diplodia intermedia]|uniref:Uncharacterized protein n=1 Tax=Diplodia intermedia TaxID=856260 RepID=A0ABR3T776_9PEZI
MTSECTCRWATKKSGKRYKTRPCTWTGCKWAALDRKYKYRTASPSPLVGARGAPVARDSPQANGSTSSSSSQPLPRRPPGDLTRGAYAGYAKLRRLRAAHAAKAREGSPSTQSTVPQQPLPEPQPPKEQPPKKPTAPSFLSILAAAERGGFVAKNKSLRDSDH